MTTPALTHIDNTMDEIHSHDVIDRIAELERRQAAAEADETGGEFSDEDAGELCDLVELELQCHRSPFWREGTALLRWTNVDDDDLRGRTYTDVDFAGVEYALRVG